MKKQNTIIKKFVVEVPGGEEITYFAIEEARHRFRREVVDAPENIITSPADYRKLLADPLNQYSLLSPESFMGMKVVVDPNLKDGEWKLVREDAKTYAIK